MARHGKQGAIAQSENPPAMPGGAAGIPELAHVPGRNDAGQALAGRREVKAPQFMVTDGPRTSDNKIRFNGGDGLVSLVPGKVVSAATHNLAMLRQQSIKLERIPDIVEDDEAPAPEPEEEPDTISA